MSKYDIKHKQLPLLVVYVGSAFMLHFVLCDDNAQILNRLVKVLEAIFVKNDIDAQISFASTTSAEVLSYVETNVVDVLILDINLKSSVSGCDIADIVRKKNKDIYIIFLTAHLEYALIAYRYKTFDYLSKPITDERLEETILRLVEDTRESHAQFIKLGNSTFIKQNDINYIKKDGMKLVFCTHTRNYEIYSSFSKIQNCLPGNFVRCHKSYIINVNNVTNFTPSNNIVLFDHDIACSIGAKYKNKFLEVFNYGNFTNNLDCVNK